MLAIALLLLPSVPAGAVEWWALQDRYLALLDLLNRFSPAAYLALIASAFTGMFNAQVRIDSLSALTGTSYGHLLLIKLALIALLMTLSASHVFGIRPRLRVLLTRFSGHPAASVARGYTSLATTLRVEPVLGLGALLCVALMGQVAPSAAAFNATVVQVVNDQSGTVSGGPIAGVVRLGALTVHLAVNPADVGQTRFTVHVAEHDQPVTDGQVRIKLSMPTTPDLGAAFVETTPGNGGYQGSGAIVQEGVWQAEVLVRTHGDPGEFRDVPFIFIASPEPTFLSAPSIDTRYGPATVRLTSPLAAPSTLAVRLQPGLRVRFVVTMPDMSPLVDTLHLQPGGWYSTVLVPPMGGFMNLAIQVQTGGAWHTVRLLVCDVNGDYQVQVLL